MSSRETNLENLKLTTEQTFSVLKRFKLPTFWIQNGFLLGELAEVVILPLPIFQKHYWSFLVKNEYDSLIMAQLELANLNVFIFNKFSNCTLIMFIFFQFFLMRATWKCTHFELICNKKLLKIRNSIFIENKLNFCLSGDFWTPSVTKSTLIFVFIMQLFDKCLNYPS